MRSKKEGTPKCSSPYDTSEGAFRVLPVSYTHLDVYKRQRLEIWRGEEQVSVDKLASANTASTSPEEAKAVYGDVVARVAAHGVAETLSLIHI